MKTALAARGLRNGFAGLILVACASTPQPAPVQRPNPEHEQRAPRVPQGPLVTPDAEFRQSPPPPSALVEFHAPIPKQLALQNGLPVFLIERHEVPLVSVTLAIRSGADTEPPGKSGLSSFVLDLLDEGTPTRDAAAIARGFEDLAARYATFADADSGGLHVTALAETLEPVLALFSDVALHPVFREGDVERVRVERLGMIAQALDDPQSVGQHVLSRVVFGEKHPWGFPAEGTVQSIKSLTRKEVAAWHQAWFRPDNAALFVVGDTTEATLLPILEKAFAVWKAGKPPKAVEHKVPKGTRTVYIVDKPGAPQSQIWIGEVGVASGAPDVFPARVMNHILGGSINSRLNSNLRTEHAYSYGVFSYFDTHRESGPFVAAGGVVSDKTAEALGEFLKELQRMKTGEISDPELADAKEALIRAIPALFASDDQIGGAYARAWSHGLPVDYYAKYQQRVEAVTKDDVAKAARERLHPDEMAIVIVGPADEIKPKIASLKLGRTEVRDANGDARKAAAAAKGAGK
ncbi:MAG: M16 family metallopeptidase [Myxococcales bacterium]